MAVFTASYARRQLGTPWELLLSSLVSAVLVLLTHSSLASALLFLSPAPSLLFHMLPFSGFVTVAAMGLGRYLKRLVGIPSSAPALVLFHFLFILGVYLALIRPGNSSMLNMVLYLECTLLVFGFFCILSSDPGVVSCGISCSELEKCGYNRENDYHKIDLFVTRVRHCSTCKSCITGLDHHCPAFGNCIGQKNHVLFITLLIGFIVVEASYNIFSFHYITEFIMNGNSSERNLHVVVVISTMHFCVIQVIWQVLFLLWHFYCVCSNIRTDEWINWKKYPEFHVQLQQGQSMSELIFKNPYDKGVVINIKEFFSIK